MAEEKQKDDSEQTGQCDAWMHRSSSMRCGTCMYYINYRCRRHAPTLQGYPAVYPFDDWCGDHKVDKKDMGGI